MSLTPSSLVAANASDVEMSFARPSENGSIVITLSNMQPGGKLVQQAGVYINYTASSDHAGSSASSSAVPLTGRSAGISSVSVGSSTSVALPGSGGVPWGPSFNDTLVLLPTDKTLELRLLIDGMMMEVIWQGRYICMQCGRSIHISRSYAW
jgi:hypothetical protein